MKQFLSTIIVSLTVLVAFSQDSLYKPGPESQRKQGMPGDVVTRYSWESKLYGNFRDYIYVPAQYDSTKKGTGAGSGKHGGPFYLNR